MRNPVSVKSTFAVAAGAGMQAAARPKGWAFPIDVENL